MVSRLKINLPRRMKISVWHMQMYLEWEVPAVCRTLNSFRNRDRFPFKQINLVQGLIQNVRVIWEYIVCGHKRSRPNVMLRRIRQILTYLFRFHLVVMNRHILLLALNAIHNELDMASILKVNKRNRICNYKTPRRYPL